VKQKKEEAPKIIIFVFFGNLDFIAAPQKNNKLKTAQGIQSTINCTPIKAKELRG
jgi:hypothetical protein